MKQTKVVLEYSLEEFIFQIAKQVREGWDFDPNQPPGQYGRMYESHMLREPTEAQVQKDAAEAAKPSRAEILAKARAAKAAKAQEATQEASGAANEGEDE